MVIKLLNLHSKNPMYRFFKRFLDLFVASIAVIMLLPLFIPISIILKLSGEGEVFYLQKRLGINQKVFSIFKFATMLKDSESIGTGIYTAKNDSRILPVGHFLRKTKINELPQILNIILGDISLVGPRPLIKRTFDLYSEEDKVIISSVKPGLTGIGSVVFRNEEELLLNAGDDIEDFYKQNITPYKASLEKWYVINKTFTVDVIILFLTAYSIFIKDTQLPWLVFKDLPKFNK